MKGAPVPILVNPAAGRRGEASAGRIERALERVGAPADVRRVEASALRDEVRRLVDARVPVVGIAGGDGSLLSAADVLAGTATALLPVPTGTLNHFARRVGIETLDHAAAVAARGTVRQLPIGLVDDRVFLNTATFGLYADVVRRRERLRRWLGKWPAAGVGFATRLAGLRQLDLTLEVGGKQLHRRTPLVWVGMGWGSFPLVHEAAERRLSPDLEIVVLRPGGRLGAVALLVRLFLVIRGRVRPVDDPALELLHARHLVIHADHAVGTTLDGEIDRIRTPLYVGVRDAALRILAAA